MVENGSIQFLAFPEVVGFDVFLEECSFIEFLGIGQLRTGISFASVFEYVVFFKVE